MAKHDQEFQFILSEGPGAPEDPKVRTLIRKQAMKNVGLARRRKPVQSSTKSKQPESGYSTDPIVDLPFDVSSAGSHSSSEPDIFDSPTDTSSDDALTPEDHALTIYGNTYSTSSSRSLSPVTFSLQTGYERTRSRFCIDITNLSALTNFNMGRTAIPLLSTQPGRLASLLDTHQSSYLDFIPARYDSSRCLAAATDALLAKAVSIIFPGFEGHQHTRALYVKALSCIQDAIADQTSNTGPDVLCAVQLLILHELLDSNGGDAFSQHVSGSARLIMHRSSSRFRTDFEKALLVTHAGINVSETMHAVQHCYLAQPPWTDILASFAQESDELTDRSPLVLNCRIKMLSLPGLWHDVKQVINSEQLFDNEAMEKLARQCQESHQYYMQWLDDYNAHCVRTSFTQVSTKELELRREVFGTVCECVMLLKRFWACVADDKRLGLEIESQALAKLVQGLPEQRTAKLFWLFSIHELSMVEAVVETQHAFEEDSRGLGFVEKRLASRKRFNLFAEYMRVQ